VEFFNIFNHPNIANPFGSSNTSFLGSLFKSPSTFGCGCATPDGRGRQSAHRFGKQPRHATRVEAYVLNQSGKFEGV